MRANLKKTEEISYKHSHEQHLRHLRQAKTTIDNADPKIHLPSRQKRINYHRQHHIVTNNRIMVSKLLEIAQSGPTQFQKDGYTRYHPLKRRKDREQRVFRQWEVITQNQRIYNRIVKTKPKIDSLPKATLQRIQRYRTQQSSPQHNSSYPETQVQAVHHNSEVIDRYPPKKSLLVARGGRQLSRSVPIELRKSGE